MPDDNAISAANNAQIRPENEPKEQLNQEKQVKSQCEDCLNSSLVKDNQTDQADAGQKLIKQRQLKNSSYWPKLQLMKTYGQKSVN